MGFYLYKKRPTTVSGEFNYNISLYYNFAKANLFNNPDSTSVNNDCIP